MVLRKLLFLGASLCQGELLEENEMLQMGSVHARVNTMDVGSVTSGSGALALRERFETMVQASVSTGEPSGITQEAANAITGTLDTLDESISNEVAVNQQDWADHIQRFTDCNDARGTSFTKADGVNAKKTTTDDAKTAHKTCRTDGQNGEDYWRGQEDVDCDDQDNYAKIATEEKDTDRCESTCATFTSVAATQACLSKADNWVDKFKSNLDNKIQKCTDSKKSADDKHTTCNGKQTSYELAFCRWEVSLRDTCDTLDTCWETALAREPARKSDLLSKIASEMVMLQCSKEIRCYLAVLVKGNTARLTQDDYDGCKNADVDASNLNITWTVRPQRAACDTQAVAIKPGDADFSNNYNDIQKQQTWYEPNTYGWVQTPQDCSGSSEHSQVNVFFQAEANDDRYETGKINFRGVKTNIGGGYDGVSTFTAPKAGLYYFTFTLLSDNTDLDQEAQFWKNGANLGIGARDGAKYLTPITSSMVIELEEGDFVDVRLLHTTAGGASHNDKAWGWDQGRGLTHFAGALVESAVGFQASADQTSANSDGKVKFGKVTTNLGKGYDPSTSAFTAPQPGVYHFSFTLQGAGEGYHEWNFHKNGEAYGIACHDTRPQWGTCTSTVVLHLNAGEFVDIRPDSAFPDTDTRGDDGGIRGVTHFEGFLVGYTVGFQAERSRSMEGDSKGKLPFSNELFDLGGGYDESTSTFIAPAPGAYIISFTVLSDNNPSDRHELQFYKNGQNYGIGCRDAHKSSYAPCSSVMIARLEKDDEIQVHMFDNAGVYGDAQERGLTHFEGALLQTR